MPSLPEWSTPHLAAPVARRRAALIVLGLLGALVLLTLVSLSTAQVGTPQGMRIAVVGATRPAAETAAAGLRAGGRTSLSPVVLSDTASARRAVRERSVDAAFLSGPATTDELIVATAAGPAAATQLAARFQAFEKARGRTLRLADAAPLPRSDRHGTAPSSVTLLLVLSGLLGVPVLRPLLGNRPGRGRVPALLTLCSVATAVAVVGTDRLALGGFRGHALAATGAATLVVLTAAVTARTLRPAGPLVAGALLLGLVLAGGAVAPWSFQPQPYRTVGPYLLTGAGADLLRSLAYFDAHAAVGPLLVVLSWALLGGAGSVVAHRRRGAATSVPRASADLPEPGSHPAGRRDTAPVTG